MKNLRRGRDTQGYLKRIDLDSSSEGYSNFMAPLRMQMIEADAKYARKHSRVKEADNVWTPEILKPSTDTYLTPEWDEFVPFPTSKQPSPSLQFVPDLLTPYPPSPAWKVCFDGFGTSTYGGPKFPILQELITGLPDDYPPFYQPQGPSKYGGSFADTICVCNSPKVACRCKDLATKTAEEVEEMDNSKAPGQTRTTPAEKAPVASAGCGVPGEHMI